MHAVIENCAVNEGFVTIVYNLGEILTLEGELRDAINRFKKTVSSMLLSELAANETTIAILTAQLDDLKYELTTALDQTTELTHALEEADALISLKGNVVDSSAELEEMKASKGDLKAQIEQADNIRVHQCDV